MAYSFRVEQAIRAASVLHKDQVRKGDTPFPYITHLVAVAMIVSDYTDDEDTVVAALLHDSIEDTDYTADELQSDFGATVMQMVQGVSEPDIPESKQGDWKYKKKVYIKQLKDAPLGSLMISAADKIHNMRCIVEEYYDKPMEFIATFGGSLNERMLMYQEISNVLNRRLNNGILEEFNHVFGEYKKFLEYAEKKKTAY